MILYVHLACMSTHIAPGYTPHAPSTLAAVSLHRFDGLTVMHMFKIEAGHVTYRDRHLVKDLENYIREFNPCGTFLGRAFSTFVQAGIASHMQC